MSEPRIRAVFFDIGETLLDRSAEYAGWARFLGVPTHTFSAVFGGVVSRGGGVRDAVAVFRPGEKLGALRRAAAAAGLLPAVAETDLYPAVRPCLRELRELGLVVGIAGNQPSAVGDEVRALDLPADIIEVSADWGFAKPDPGFFREIARLAGCPPESVVYVGDQLDNDVAATLSAGMLSVRVLTGPWGYLVRDAQVEAGCLAVIDSLAELPGVLRAALG
jgi:FMN phosphatase YigB (HAD superfamily)